MPYMLVKTNLAIDKSGQQDLAMECSNLCASLLGKSENYVMVNIEAEQSLVFAASNEPCAYVEFKSLGLPEEQTSDFSNSLCDVISANCQIPSDRIYIEFSNPQRHLWGWNKRTF